MADSGDDNAPASTEVGTGAMKAACSSRTCVCKPSRWVDPTGQLSNPCPALERMLAKRKSLVKRGESTRPAPRRPQQQVRLSDAQQAELVQRHRDGAFRKELARAYGIHVETVRAIIRRAALQS